MREGQGRGEENEAYSLEKAAVIDDFCPGVGSFSRASDWREIVKLWCGLTNNSTALIEAVYQRDSLTAFECLADAQEVKQEVAQEIIETFKTQLGTDEAICSAFGSVAADFRIKIYMLK